jgi:multidrug efflux system membrane fusion protein
MELHVAARAGRFKRIRGLMRNPSVFLSRQTFRASWRIARTGACVLATAGCGAKTPVRAPRAAIAVTVTTVRRASVPYTVDANGVVTPLQTATVVPQVDGIVTDVTFAEGQDVSKGQILFRIDPRPYQAAFDQATAAIRRDRATATYAKAAAARFDTLAESRSVTRDQDDQARATAAAAQSTVDADQANLDKAKFDLDNTTVRAPIGGRTGSLLVHVGNVVHAAGSAPLVVIIQVKPTMVRFSVPGAELPKILHYGGRGGLPVTVLAVGSTPAGSPRDTATPMDASGAPAPAAPLGRATGVTPPDPERTGTLSFIDNSVDTTTGTVQLKATFANRSGALWAGQFVSTSLRLFVEDSALVVPTGSVVTGQTGTYVWVVDSSNTAQERPVVVERTAGDMSVITSGISEGERVVTSGQSRLTSGASVTLGGRGDSTSGGRRGGRGGRGGRSGRGGGRGGTGQGSATP